MVKIYLTPHRNRGRRKAGDPVGKRDFYTVSYWVDGKRKRQVLTTLQAAKDEANTIAIGLTKGDLGAAELSSADRAAYNRAVVLLEPSGASLEFAASEYASAVKRLGAVSLSQVVDYYLKRHPVHMEPKMVPEVVEEILELKRNDGLSARYLKQLEYDLTRFAGRFRGRLIHVQGVEIDRWLRELGVGPRTRNNLRTSIQMLFNFAMGRKYLPKDHDAMDAVPVAKDADGEIEIFTPEEMQELLAVASEGHVAFLGISGFAGVRHAEVQRLQWQSVKRKEGIIEIRPGTAKTASRRVIPIVPNLMAWLERYGGAAGEVCPYANMGPQFVELTRRVNAARALQTMSAQARERREEALTEEAVREILGKERMFKWKHNALRHSFISYRVAETQNVAQVALEAGNSPQMIFKHYRELVTPKAAKAWFSIAPKRR